MLSSYLDPKLEHVAELTGLPMEMLESLDPAMATDLD